MPVGFPASTLGVSPRVRARARRISLALFLSLVPAQGAPAESYPVHGAPSVSANPAAGRALLDIIKPPAAFPSPVPLDAEVVFDAEATGDGPAYSWDFGDGTAATAFASQARVVHRYARPGRYTVVARIRDAAAQKTFTFFVLAHPPLAARRPASAGPILVDGARGRVWSVNPDHGTVACIDGRALSLLFEVPVGRHPATLAQAPDGAIWVANRDDATVSILSPSDGALLKTLVLPFSSRPQGIAFSPDGKAALITLEASGSLAKADPSARTLLGVTPVGLHARGLAVSPDGMALVTHFISDGYAGLVTGVEAASLSVARKIPLGEDSTADTENGGGGSPNHLASVTFSPDGAFAWVTAKKDNLRRGTFRDGRALTFENTVRTYIARIDAAAGREAEALRLDIDDSEGATAMAFGPLGYPAFVAFQGSNRVLAWDPYADVRVMTIAGVGAAPQGLAVDSAAGRLFVQNFLDRTVSVFDIGELASGRESSAPLLKVVRTAAGEPLSERVLRGKRIFHDASDPRMSRDGYLSCATCHGDGGSDGRVWDFTDRGEGLRKTASLLGRAGTGYGPLHWSANFDEIQDFEHDIRNAFGGIGFMKEDVFRSEGRDKALGGRKAGWSPELDDLAAYVASLGGVPPSPYRAADGSMTAEARNGRALFNQEDVGCARCHVQPSFTDSRLPLPGEPMPKAGPGDTVTAEGFLLHDVGTLKPGSGSRMGAQLRGVDTPGLLGIWNTGPYLHDGSAASLEDVIGSANKGDRHGKTSHLSGAERDALVAYLRQLDDLDDQGRTGIDAGRRYVARGWRLTATPIGDGGSWRILVSGFTARKVTLGLHDFSGRNLRKVFLPTDGPVGTMAWILDGNLPGGRSAFPAPVLLRACSGEDCQGRRFPPGGARP